MLNFYFILTLRIDSYFLVRGYLVKNMLIGYCEFKHEINFIDFFFLIDYCYFLYFFNDEF